MSWKKLSSKSVYKNKWIEVTEDQVQTETGKEYTYGVVRKKPFTLIVPWDGENFFLVGQYRYAVNEYSWEFPQGHYEHCSIEETAREELREETGLMAKSVKKIAEFTLAPGLTDQICNVFLATGLSAKKTAFEESEVESGMRVKKITRMRFEKMISSGQIKDGPTLAAYGIAVVRGLLE